MFGASDLRFGGYAEYACLPADGLLARKPEEVSFEQVVALPVGGLAALGYLRKGGVQRAKTVLVRGASGSIGTYAVQLAEPHGAQVTAVCGPAGVARVRDLGADIVVDYTQQDFLDRGDTYDLILDVVGKMPISRCLRALNPEGAYVRGTVPGVWELWVALWVRVTRRKRVVLGDAGGSAEDLVSLAKEVASGQLVSVVDRRYPLDEVAEAHRYVDTGHKQGHVVIQVRAGSSGRGGASSSR